MNATEEKVSELIATLPWIGDCTLEDIERVLTKAIHDAITAEREACAQIAETFTTGSSFNVRAEIAAAIRARREEGR